MASGTPAPNRVKLGDNVKRGVSGARGGAEVVFWHGAEAYEMLLTPGTRCYDEPMV